MTGMLAARNLLVKSTIWDVNTERSTMRSSQQSVAEICPLDLIAK